MTADERFMRCALTQARRSAARDEVPVGAVVVKNGVILARAGNTRQNSHDPAGHAEINAMRRAAQRLGGWNLHDCELFVTLEPCPMCTGAAINARIARIVFGAADPKAGACGSVLRLCETPELNHHPAITGGVLEEPCAQILKDYFKCKRRAQKNAGGS